MKTILIGLLLTFALSALASGEFKNVGNFNCKSTSIIFPYESPKLLFSIRLEAKISTKEYDLSTTPEMSIAEITMAYMIRKSNESNILEQGIYKGETISIDLPYSSNHYRSVSYKLVSSSNSQGYRELFLSLPINFDLYRTFAIKFRIGEFDNRNTEDIALSCKNLNYQY